eukprot:TRINITY_DN232_c0_g3_i2.p1 TRINITY_DN232_c0_g3~~TRINITY_DN232_c0_g3_i2.p1  ORF type:complete len:688 (+),score=170.11 TRINITY_DN232_c0_g3_i2:324-2387(+)
MHTGTLSVFLTMLFTGRTSIDAVATDLRGEVIQRVDLYLSSYLQGGPAGVKVFKSSYDRGDFPLHDNSLAAKAAHLPGIREYVKALSNINVAIVTIVELSTTKTNPTWWIAGENLYGWVEDGLLKLKSVNPDGSIGGPYPGLPDTPLSYDEQLQLAAIGTNNFQNDTFWSPAPTVLLLGSQPYVVDGFYTLLRDQANNPIGLLSVVVSLVEVDAMLQSIKLGKSGFVYLTDENDNLLSSSVGASNTFIDPVARGLGVRKATNIPSFPLISESFNAGGDFKSGGTNYIYEKAAVSSRAGWTVHVVVPSDDFFGSIKRTERMTIGIVCAIIVVALLTTIVVSRAVVKPLRQVSHSMDRAARFDLRGHEGEFSSIVELNNIQASLLRMQLGLQSFSRYVPVELVRQLLVNSQSAVLGVEKKHLTFMFLDIRNFTTFVEGLEQGKMIELLSEFFDLMIGVIHKHGGTVDKLIGDAVMAFWGAPLAIEQAERKACLAALECQQELAELRKRCTARNLPEISARIGLHCGEASVGNVGAHSRLNYTALGDSVNLASRMEGLNDLFGTDITVSSYVRDKVDKYFVFRHCDRVMVKGRTTPTDVYQLMMRKQDDSGGEAENLAAKTSQVVEMILTNQLQKASISVDDALTLHPNDGPLTHLRTRVHDLMKNPSQGGVLDLKSKTFALSTANAGGV